MKTFFASVFVFSLVWAGMAAAQEIRVDAVVQAEAVTTADLGVEEPGLLPTSPWYFFKEIGRGLQRALTFNAVAKTELELKIASEKAAEAKKVAEQDPRNERGISRALTNYERAQERLRARLESLRETSENPNIDRLLDMVAQRQIVHERLLSELEARHTALRGDIQNVRARTQATFGEIARKDTAEKFQERIENALERAKGSVEILDRLQASEHIPDQTREYLQQVADRIRERLETLPLPLRPIPPAGDDGDEEAVFCTQEYAPVCGVDGKTYSNRCVAEQQNNVRVQYEGECRANDADNSEAQKYQSRNPEECRRLQFLCVEGFQRFDDATGCGCEKGDSPNTDSSSVPPPTPVVSVPRNFAVRADDNSMDPSEIRVPRGTKVTITFHVSESNVYYGGLDFRSSKFTTEQILPGNSTTVEFTAEESFEFKSYWPSSDVRKATGRVIVE